MLIINKKLVACSLLLTSSFLFAEKSAVFQRFEGEEIEFEQINAVDSVQAINYYESSGSTADYVNQYTEADEVEFKQEGGSGSTQAVNYIEIENGSWQGATQTADIDEVIFSQKNGNSNKQAINFLKNTKK